MMKTTPRDDMLTAPSLAHAVCDCMAVTWEELVGRSRQARYSTPRKILAYLLRQRTSLTLQDIGDMIGGRDHSTVLYWVKTTQLDRGISPVLERMINTIEENARSYVPEQPVNNQASSDGQGEEDQAD